MTERYKTHQSFQTSNNKPYPNPYQTITNQKTPILNLQPQQKSSDIRKLVVDKLLDPVYHKPKFQNRSYSELQIENSLLDAKIKYGGPSDWESEYGNLNQISQSKISQKKRLYQNKYSENFSDQKYQNIKNQREKEIKKNFTFASGKQRNNFRNSRWAVEKLSPGKVQNQNDQNFNQINEISKKSSIMKSRRGISLDEYRQRVKKRGHFQKPQNRFKNDKFSEILEKYSHPNNYKNEKSKTKNHRNLPRKDQNPSLFRSLAVARQNRNLRQHSSARKNYGGISDIGVKEVGNFEQVQSGQESDRDNTGGYYTRGRGANHSYYKVILYYCYI